MDIWSIISQAVLLLVSSYVYLLLFWRRLKEDYTYSQILSTGFYSIFGIAIGVVVSDNFFSNWWFWCAFLGGLLGLTIGILRFKLRVFETLEAAIVGILPVVAFVFLYDGLITQSIISLISSSVVFILLLVFFVLDKHYKKFTWYRSGRVGFAGFTIFGFFFLLRAAVAVISSDVLSFVEGKEVYLSGIMAFSSFLILFNLSRE